jgi:hypothetical protein
VCREKILVSFRVPRAKKFENHCPKMMFIAKKIKNPAIGLFSSFPENSENQQKKLELCKNQLPIEKVTLPF